MLSSEIKKKLQASKNLLAFSAGVDSSALFFLLQEANISFDIAIVDYGVRKESQDEIAYAKELASKFNKKIFLAKAPEFKSNFEKKARDFRYSFFEAVIKNKGYDTLLSAHQLNDKLEWLLMRLSKGAGVEELAGMQEIEKRDDYLLIRPLLDTTKEELQEYLEQKGYKYFIDKSNFDTRFERNRFRELANELLANGKNGFIKSFNILSQESKLLQSSYKRLFTQKKFVVIKFEKRELAGSIASKYLKKFGYLLSGKEREALKQQNSLVAGRAWAIEIKENKLFIAPYCKVTLPKEFKETCRRGGIPPKVRSYLFRENIKLRELFKRLKA